MRGRRPSSAAFRLRMEGSGRSWGFRSTANGCCPIVKMADEECVWSLEGRVEKARVSVIVQHLCRGRPQPLNLLHVAWMNGHFYIGGGRGVNKQALRATQWRWARGGSMAKSRLHRMHPRWLKATTPKRLTHGHLGLKVSKSHGSKPNHVFI